MQKIAIGKWQLAQLKLKIVIPNEVRNLLFPAEPRNSRFLPFGKAQGRNDKVGAWGDNFATRNGGLPAPALLIAICCTRKPSDRADCRYNRALRQAWRQKTCLSRNNLTS